LQNSPDLLSALLTPLPGRAIYLTLKTVRQMSLRCDPSTFRQMFLMIHQHCTFEPVFVIGRKGESN
jgi:hypothetical protein